MDAWCELRPSRSKKHSKYRSADTQRIFFYEETRSYQRQRKFSNFEASTGFFSRSVSDSGPDVGKEDTEKMVTCI